MDKIISTNHKQRQTSFGIRGRLFSGFAILTVVLMLAVGLILTKLMATNNIAQEAIDIDMTTYETTNALTLELTQAQSMLRTWILTHDTQYKIGFFATWKNINKLKPSLEALSKQWHSLDEHQHWEETSILLSQLQEAQIKIINDPSQDANVLFTRWKAEVLPMSNQVLDTFIGHLTADGDRTGGMLEIQNQKLRAGTADIISNISTVQFTAYSIVIFTIIFSFFIAWITSKRIITPLNSAITIAKKIAAGDRNLSIRPTHNDEAGELLVALDMMQNAIKANEEKIRQSEINARQLFDKIVNTAKHFSEHSSKVAAGDLRQRLEVATEDVMYNLGTDLNQMTENIAAMTKQIADASHHIVSIVEEVRRSVEVQSTGASEQAASINEITSSLAEIEKSSSHTLEKAKSLGDAARQTHEKGQQGQQAIEESVNGMKSVREKVELIAQTILELSHQTQQVGEITDVVNNLAQQSKMLALNASIEAAKAVEAGKGFSVVATEVKNLAEQSEQSTEHVRKILEEIRVTTEKAVMMTEEGTKSVDRGTAMVENTGEIISTLNGVIQGTTIASQQIEAAVHQESVGIEQISIGMNEINKVTASFVESAKQTTEAIESLAITTLQLKKDIDIYKI